MSRTYRKKLPLTGLIHEDTDRDSRKQHKAPKRFKKPRRRIEKAKIKAAVRDGKDLPKIKHNDVFDWL
jgi:hypothetical protein